MYFRLDIILEKKLIMVVFQDQAMYARTSLRSAKTCKIGKKKGVFLVILTNFGKDMEDKLRKTHAKMHIAKLEKKGVFLVILTNFGKDMADKLKKTHAKMHIYRVYFHT